MTSTLEAAPGIEPNAFRSRVATRNPIAIFLDVDGTLLDLADKPNEVVTPPRLIPTLASIQGALSGALALVSGRGVQELDRLFAPLQLRASGVHGAQMRFEPGAPVVAAPEAVELPHALWSDLQQLLRGFPGTFAENKRFSFAVHFRQAPEVEAPLRKALKWLVKSQPLPSLQLMDAHFALEIKTAGFNKGVAVSRFLATAPFLGRTPLYIGDDDTDEAAFAAVEARSGFAFSVGRARPHTSGVFVEPQSVRDWLADIARSGDLK